MHRQPSTREMRRAFLASDASYDGIFFTAVKTTGVFCRPSCRARKPKPENIRFFATPRAAMFSGYRPCKRCRPLDTDGRPPAWVAQLLQRLEASPARRIGAAELSSMGIDAARARRYFLAHYGMTFQAFCRARRLRDAFQRIRQGATVTQTALESGFESESGFRSAYARAFGAAPTEEQSRPPVTIGWIETPVGPLVAGTTDSAVCLLEFSDRRMLETQFAAVRRRLRAALVPGSNRWLDALRVQLGEYFAGARRKFDLPLSFPGTTFQEKVWSALLEIPYGSTCSYQDIARRLGQPAAVRAVGAANGMNRIAIVIPCHRVVNANGGLGGYGGGLWRKQLLLDLEAGQRPLLGADPA